MNNYLRFAQATRAHFVDENHLLYAPSAARVGQELTALSDECSAGTFTVAPDALQMMVRDTLDSSLMATNISAGPSTIPITLQNTDKVQASLEERRTVTTGPHSHSTVARTDAIVAVNAWRNARRVARAARTGHG